jgi:hypothetical protein
VAEDKYSKARKARGLRKTILSPDDEPDTLKRAREEVRNTRGIETIKTGGKIMAVHMGKKKMAKGDMMKEEKMMKREGRGMAKADMQKMMGKKKMMVWLKKKMMAKKGYHKMPDGKMMKDSAHKGVKKMAHGGRVKKGCDGVATKGKTKGNGVMRASRGMGCMSEKKLKKLKEGGTVKDACYKKVKASYKVFPSAYASGAIAKCRKNKGK